MVTFIYSHTHSRLDELTMQIDLVKTWLNNVAISHSNSNRTRVAYKTNFQRFCSFIHRTPEQIMIEYDSSTDREFKRQYARYIQAFMSAELERGMAQNTINTRLAAVKSFFKYNNLPLGYIPAPKMRVTYHNRDITHEEVKLILNASRPRERAFFGILAQSGLRPYSICNLKFKHIKEDFIANHVPCKIDVPQEIAKGKYRGYFTFIGHEAVEYLKAYLHTRRRITDDEFLFVKQGSKQQANPKSFSNLFSRTLQKLEEQGLIEVEQKKTSKPRDVRLYSLRKFFRKHANQAGFEFVEFWMGHVVKTGQEEYYRPTDVEFHRKLYTEKAMPFLRLETSSPLETEKAITTLEQENRELKDQIKKLENSMEKIYQKVFHEEITEEEHEKWLEENAKLLDEEVKEYDEALREEEDYLAKHPEERKRREEHNRELYEERMKYLDEHSEEFKEQEKWIEEEEIRLDERRKTLQELQDIIKKVKEANKN